MCAHVRRGCVRAWSQAVEVTGHLLRRTLPPVLACTLWAAAAAALPTLLAGGGGGAGGAQAAAAAAQGLLAGAAPLALLLGLLSPVPPDVSWRVLCVARDRLGRSTASVAAASAPKRARRLPC